MNHKRATKQETGIISHGHLVWMFAPVAGHVILILIKSEKLKAYYMDFALEPKQAEIYTKKVVSKILEKRKLLKLLIFVVIYFLCLIMGACYIEFTETSKCPQF